ncbi:MAG: hypothetical protein ACTS2F_06910 [Thainema sp.]
MTRHTSFRFAALGLLAGTIAIAPAAKAQITVTGGEASGQAAFFTPDTDPEENLRLFDINVQQLLIESENGTTSTSIFTPSAASFTDANANGVPDANDTGVLQGTLSGVAFTESGTPIPFTGAPTSLDFTLTSFDANIGTIGGSLIAADDPGDAPLIFLPGASDVNVITEGFSSSNGDLDIGEFEAGLDDGKIGLPNTLSFMDSGSTPIPTPAPTTGITGRFQFDFKGENVTAGEGTDFDFADDEIRFVGEANDEFRIRTAGETRGQDLKLDIRAEVGAIDITLGGPFDQLRVDGGSIDPDQPIDKYEIDGDAEGIFAFYNSSTYGFASTGENNTRFKFEQGDNELRGRTDRDEGIVQFFAATGVADLDDSFDFDNVDVDDVDVSEGSGSTCNACGSSIDFDVDDDGDIDDDDEFVFVPASFTRTVERSSRVAFISTTPISVNLFSPYTVNVSNTASYQYQFLTVYRFDDIDFGDDFDDDDFGSGTVRTIRVQQVRISGTTYYCIFPRTGTATLITAYKQVGPTSRIFPGLAGLEEVSEEELEGVVLVGLQEIDDDVEYDDDDDLDDTDDDDDDLDDDDSDDSDDTDDSDNDSDDSDDDSDDTDDSDDDSSDDDSDDSDDDLDDTDDSDDDDLDDDLDDDTDDSSDDSSTDTDDGTTDNTDGGAVEGLGEIGS